MEELKDIFLEYPSLMTLPLGALQVESNLVSGYLLAHTLHHFTPQEQTHFAEYFTETHWRDFLQHLAQVLRQPDLARWVVQGWGQEPLREALSAQGLLAIHLQQLNHPQFLSHSGLTVLVQENVFTPEQVGAEMLAYLKDLLEQMQDLLVSYADTKIKPVERIPLVETFEPCAFAFKLKTAHRNELAGALMEFAHLGSGKVGDSFDEIRSLLPAMTQKASFLTEQLLNQLDIPQLEEVSTFFFRLHEGGGYKERSPFFHIKNVLSDATQKAQLSRLTLETEAVILPKKTAINRPRI